MYRRESIFGFTCICLPQSQNNYIPVLFYQKNCCKPCLMYECLAGKWKPSWGQLCVQVDHPNPSPLSHDWCMVRTAPPSSVDHGWPT
jgi:hypothetical protein